MREESSHIDYALARLLDTDTRLVHHLATQLIESLLLEAQATVATAAKPTR